MLLRQIKYYVSVVEAGSFTEAAAKCFISQSAVSQQIQALERELGVELLCRSGRKFTLTAAGEHFYQKGRLLLEEAEQLCRETRKMGERSAPQLRTGYLNCYGGPEFQMAVAEFTHRHPEVAIEITGGSHEDLYEALRLGRMDAILSDQRRAFSDAYGNQLLAVRELCIEIAGRSPLARRESLTAEDLKLAPCILVATPGQRENERAYYRDIAGLNGEFLFAENLEQARLMAAGGKGYMPAEGAPGTRTAAMPFRRIPLLRDGKPVLRSYCAFWRVDDPNPYTGVFVDILKDQFELT